jgi:hypothetical protein
MPSHIIEQFMEMAGAESHLAYQGGILADMMKGSEPSYPEMDRIWSDYLNSRNRFELIRSFLSDKDWPNLMEQLKAGQAQLVFNFKPAACHPDATAAFTSRINAIRPGK